MSLRQPPWQRQAGAAARLGLAPTSFHPPCDAADRATEGHLPTTVPAEARDLANGRHVRSRGVRQAMRPTGPIGRTGPIDQTAPNGLHSPTVRTDPIVRTGRTARQSQATGRPTFHR